MKNVIDLTKAQAETHSFQASPIFENLTKSCSIEKSAYDFLLAQPGVVEIRTYFALNTNNNLTIVVVGVNNFGEDITNGIILGDTKDCPFNCPNNSPLML